MSVEIIQTGDCCSDCSEAPVTQVPGPPGANGANGTNGTNGVSAFTLTTANFTMPVIGNDVVVSVLNGTWATPLQVVYVGVAGYMQVDAATSNSLTLQNLGYSGNFPPGLVVGSGQQVSPAGQIGPTGASGGGTLNALAPTTTKGDIMADNGANSPNASVVRLGIGSNKNVLHVDTTQPTDLNYKAIDLSGSATNITGATPIANGGTANTTAQAAINALANKPGSSQGDILWFNGTNWIRFPKGTALQQIRTNAGATDIEWFTPSTTSQVAQMVSANNNAYSSGLTIIPADDTIPQITEGTQILAASITPTTNTSRIVCTVYVPAACGSIEDVTVALFQGGVANSLSSLVKALGLNGSTEFFFTYVLATGATSAVTLSVRIGSDIGAQWEVNGASGARKLGGAQRAYLIAVEYL